MLSRGCKEGRSLARQASLDECPNLDLAKERCKFLLDPAIFNQCSCQVDPKPFYQNCLYDMVGIVFLGLIDIGIKAIRGIPVASSNLRPLN